MAAEHADEVPWQLITGEKVFQDVQPYMQATRSQELGLDYHVVSVFGSQSTGYRR